MFKCAYNSTQQQTYSDFDIMTESKVHEAKMATTWVLSAPDGPRVGPMNLAINDMGLSVAVSA